MSGSYKDEALEFIQYLAKDMMKVFSRFIDVEERDIEKVKSLEDHVKVKLVCRSRAIIAAIENCTLSEEVLQDTKVTVKKMMMCEKKQEENEREMQKAKEILKRVLDNIEELEQLENDDGDSPTYH